ncbi:GNAT family N-acetyltransferase, partial [Streptomyces tanashiensis]
MTWSFTDSAAAFRAAAAEHLAADPARNTAVLTLMDTAGRLGWWEEADGRVTGVLAVGPPGVPAFGAMTEEAARALAPGEDAGDPAVRLFPPAEPPGRVHER